MKLGDVDRGRWKRKENLICSAFLLFMYLFKGFISSPSGETHLSNFFSVVPCPIWSCQGSSLQSRSSWSSLETGMTTQPCHMCMLWTASSSAFWTWPAQQASKRPVLSFHHSNRSFRVFFSEPVMHRVVKWDTCLLPCPLKLVLCFCLQPMQCPVELCISSVCLSPGLGSPYTNFAT